LQPNPSSELEEEEEEVQVTKDQLAKFQSVLYNIFQEKNRKTDRQQDRQTDRQTEIQQIPYDEVQAIVTEKTNFGEALIMGCIEQMADKNKVMLAKGILYLN
jgi:hypothetical protein